MKCFVYEIPLLSPNMLAEDKYSRMKPSTKNYSLADRTDENNVKQKPNGKILSKIYSIADMT